MSDDDLQSIRELLATTTNEPCDRYEFGSCVGALADAIWFEHSRGMGRALLAEVDRLRAEVGRLRGEARELERATPQGRVLAVLEGAHVPLTLPAILRDAHTHRARTLKFLHELVAEGAVVREGAGKRSQPFFYALSTWYTSQRERWGDD